MEMSRSQSRKDVFGPEKRSRTSSVAVIGYEGQWNSVSYGLWREFSRPASGSRSGAAVSNWNSADGWLLEIWLIKAAGNREEDITGSK